jgi:hypothetical protein
MSICLWTLILNMKEGGSSSLIKLSTFFSGAKSSNTKFFLLFVANISLKYFSNFGNETPSSAFSFSHKYTFLIVFSVG